MLNRRLFGIMAGAAGFTIALLCLTEVREGRPDGHVTVAAAERPAGTAVDAGREPQGDASQIDPETALARYIARPEAEYGWTLKEVAPLGDARVYRMELTSQTWQGNVWKHVLNVYEPATVRFSKLAVLFVSGGSRLKEAGLEEQILAVGLANLCGGRVALLKQVPNQPLLDNRFEDDLISETWLRYLKTGDENWPLLFPMVKSAVKAMDAVQDLGRDQHWPEPVDQFLITGASKRGWTSWLTPTVEPRVVATAPIVIDMLNFQSQMRYQIESWGRPSEQIADYTSKGLVRVDGPETPREAALRLMMDPFAYREKLSLPKLAINATNDRYWVVDAAKNYWHDLPGPKAVLEIPNVGHSIGSGLPVALAGVAALFRKTASEETLPQVTWQFEQRGSERRIIVQSDPPAVSGHVWTARSQTNDFRDATWTAREMPKQGGRYEVTLSAEAAEPCQANFCELKFRDTSIDPPLTYSLTTIVKRWEKGK